MKKPVTVTVRCTRELKELAIARARQEHRSLTAHFAWLVEQDARQAASGKSTKQAKG